MAVMLPSNWSSSRSTSAVEVAPRLGEVIDAYCEHKHVAPALSAGSFLTPDQIAALIRNLSDTPLESLDTGNLPWNLVLDVATVAAVAANLPQSARPNEKGRPPSGQLYKLRWRKDRDGNELPNPIIYECLRDGRLKSTGLSLLQGHLLESRAALKLCFGVQV